MNTSGVTLATSIPTNRFTSSMFHPPQRGLPRLAIRDFFPLQPFGLSACSGAATGLRVTYPFSKPNLALSMASEVA
jgi:hypothetical protein